MKYGSKRVTNSHVSKKWKENVEVTQSNLNRFAHFTIMNTMIFDYA